MKRNCLQPQPFTDHPLWPDGCIPLTQPGDETLSECFLESDDAIARLTNIATPTMSFFPAVAVDGRPRPAVVVCPGGGYSILAWNHEGLDIVSWLNCNGISAILLKYRCPNRRDAALADVARAIRLIRSNATILNIVPDKIGIIGFSAGAHLAARLSTLPAGKEPYAPIDVCDKISLYPNFQFIIYPAYIIRDNWTIDPDFEPSSATPPAFIMQSEDDTYADSALSYFIALRKAGVKAELHIFSHGLHGYGMLRNGNPTQAWPELAIKWLASDILGSVW